MSLHNWSKQPAGNFHAFHNSWISELQKALNRGLLPPGFMALGEQLAGDIGPDVLTLKTSAVADQPIQGGILLAEHPPKVHRRDEAATDSAWYAAKSRSIVIRHATGQAIVAVIEIVSPGNKQSRGAVQKFVEKVSALVSQGIHTLVIDPLFPRHFPDQLHELIWDHSKSEKSKVQNTFYQVEESGHIFRDELLFLTPGVYVNVPLEATYSAAFDGMPQEIQRQLNK